MNLCSRSDGEEEVTIPTNGGSKPKSLIAILAERRKAHKSIHSFAPNAIPSAPVRTTKPSIPSCGGSSDLLGDILASQTQLKRFGKAESPVNSPPVRAVTSRVLSAILASKDTLSRLDRDLERLTKSVNNGSDSATSSGQKQQCASGSRSSQQPGSNSRQPLQSGPPARNGASNGGDDPDGNRRKRKAEPDDKPEDGDEEEPAEEESESADNSIKLQANQVQFVLMMSEFF